MLNFLSFAFLEEITFEVIMSKVGSILIAFVILLFMITVHELGHYTAGRLLNFKINEFMIGFGPKLFSRKNEKTGEVFSLRLLPLGGGCVFEGEDEDNHNPQAFNNQKPWKRVIVLISGAFFNLICAILVAILLFSCFGEPMMTVQKVEENSSDGYSVNYDLFEPGDIIVAVNGKNIYLFSDLSELFSKADNEMTVKVFRPADAYKEWKEDALGNPYLVVNVTSFEEPEQGGFVELVGIKSGVFQRAAEEGKTEDYIGWGITQNRTRIKSSFFKSIGKSFEACTEAGTLIIKFLGKLLTGKVALKEVGGPISTIGGTSEVVEKGGFANVLYLIVLISVNLAIFNLLPVPALDGCRVVFVLIEMIFRKPVKRNIEALIHLAGIIFLLGFALLVDVLKWF